MANTEVARGHPGEDPRIAAGTEAVVSVVALLAIYFLSVTTDPFRDPNGWLVFIPFAALVVTYILAFGSFVKQVT
ncbi:MAG: hypothetical protein ACE5LS_02845 [Thermoplasmata archaeon]